MIRWARITGVFVFLLSIVCSAQAQEVAPVDTATQLFYKMRDRLNEIHDYEADVRMKIDVSFMKVPPLSGKLYFKAPDKMKLERNGGISILPKKNVSLALNNLFPAGGATVINAGFDTIDQRPVRIIKVVPDDDKNDIILTKIWVDEQRMVALRTETTTRESGTVKMDLAFGKYVQYGLPDKIVIHVDVNEYKLPKGVTMDYDVSDAGIKRPEQKTNKRKKGKIEINYLNYEVNKGLPDNIFTKND